MAKAFTYRSLVDDAIGDSACRVSVERRGAVAIVRMDQPEHYNALTPALCWQLRERIEECAGDRDLRVIVLTGADPAFCAGGDLELIASGEHAIKQGEDGATAIWRWIRYQFGGVVRAITQSDKLFVAAINGPAAGVGMAFALACDHRIASERASLVLAFGRIGLVPEVGTSWWLTRRLGYQRALDLFVLGKPLTATEAERLQLLERVVPHAALLPTALAWAERACDLAENVTAMAKAQLRRISDMSWEQSLAIEEFAEPLCFTTDAHRAALRKTMQELSVKAGAPR